MAIESSTTRAEAQIRSLIDDRVRTVRTKDINKLMAHHAPDVVSFDAVTTLQYIGADAPKKRAEEWFSSYKSSIGYEIRDLHITAGEDVAFCHFLYRISGTMTNGGEVNMWVRDTVCYRKIDGSWLLTHEHTSVPFDIESGNAALDLKP